MPTAKETFLDRMTNFENALSSTDVVSRALTEVEHNQKARMLRNGLAIVEYTILEDFLKKRMGEVLKEIGSTTVPFNSLPKSLQEVALVNALKGIQTRALTLKNASEDYKLFIQEETTCVSSTKNSVYEISQFSIGWTKSNISESDLTEFLANFNVKGGWQTIKHVSNEIGVSLADPSAIFRNAAQRRHSAAHNASADSLLSDLIDFVSQAKVIALAFDTLISTSLKYIKDNNRDFLAERLKTEYTSLSFRFLRKVGTKWKEFKKSSSRAVKVASDLSTLLPDSLSRATSANEILVIKDSRNMIVDWHNL